MRRLFLILCCSISLAAFGSCASKAPSTESAAEATAVEAPSADSAQAAQPDSAAPIPTIIDFSATWCPPCKAFAPIFHDVAKDYVGKVNFITIDVDAEQELAMRFRVSSVPTIVALDANGNLVGRKLGYMDRQQFVDFINSSLKL